MENVWEKVTELFADPRVVSVARAVLMVLLGILVARLAGRATARVVAKRAQPQQALLARRAVFYSLLALTLVAALDELGFELSVFLGAAGVLTVALGFASQTSASNLISGLFLIGERPFVVGDRIQISGTGTKGEVLSVDLLSVKIRTFDNLYVRVPNETLVKSEIINLTHFPIRRLDLMIPLSYREDIGRVRAILEEVAARNPLCLEEPKPLYLFDHMSDSALVLQFSVWAARERYFELKGRLAQEILRAFQDDGVDIAYPRRILESGVGSEPVEVRMAAAS